MRRVGYTDSVARVLSLHLRQSCGCVCLGLPSYSSLYRQRFFRCCGLVQQCNGGVVDGSAQRGSLSTCSHVGWEYGAVRWGLDTKYVAWARVGHAFSCELLQVQFLMLLTCTTVQRGRGRQLGSAWRAVGSQPRRLGTWRCSLGAAYICLTKYLGEVGCAKIVVC